MFADEEGLSFAIPGLLLQVGANRRASIMPDKARSAEAALKAALMQAPANIDVISRFAKNRIKTINLLERPLVEGHVAPWNVLRFVIGEHHVSRAARRHKDSRGHG